MPRNFKEALIFTCLMCTMMVLFMSTWNLFVIGKLSISNVIGGFIPGFACAFLIDMIVIGPLAKNLVKKLPFKLEKRWQKIVAISSLMVVGMVSSMSFYGLFVNNLSLSLYPKIWLTNFVAALPLNLLVVGPIARFILGSIQNINSLQIEQ